MSTDAHLLDWLEPPNKGLSELKGKLRRRASRRKGAAGITATAVVVFATISIFHDGGNPTAPRAPTDDQWQAAISAQEEGISVINGAALELSGPDADTRIYLVSTLQQEPDPGSG